ncbi:metallophosphoesterase [Agrobacterium rubi]|uniref:Metallophosphoesterase n=1 Tax=Agrobacterium rubi TaxID=28099 RepID=A0AAE7UNL0_9HYPH|nr:metallophosphoesterase [Agrobacterium rubi]NTE85823.1 metallophosphoesterase [Agrobacterium rubi]NTF01755.1 metallophosphoesterase [Agrobacterium rubi]NTF35998.1 metallophosphoesterase [Agrobacterium rubi]OCJ53198.1 metallophosphoesterase [Agrobacterium rubi]QTG01088.1 metallophosphoesterase [Agrobacterium rubi]
MFHLIFGIPWLVVAVRFLQPLPWLWSVKAVLALILLIASQYHLFNRLSSGSVFSPEFFRPLVIAFNVLMGAIILLAFLQIALDIISLVMWPFKGHFPAVPVGVRYAMGLAALGLSAFAVSQAVRVPPLKDIEVAIPGLPQSFDGYQMVQLTDLHISRLFSADWANSVVEKTNALNPDLIVITGDLIDGSIQARSGDIAPLANLRARDGVITVAGNHEYFFGYEEWMKYYQGLNMTTLINGHTVLDRNGEKLVIAGVTDLSSSRTPFPQPDIAAALRGAPEQAPIILLDHQPKEAARNAKMGVALQLSGHTHGGMVLGLHKLVARANNGFVSGFYQVGSMQLYVNNGTALWPGFALRLGKPSELTRFTLRRAP